MDLLCPCLHMGKKCVVYGSRLRRCAAHCNLQLLVPLICYVLRTRLQRSKATSHSDGGQSLPLSVGTFVAKFVHVPVVSVEFCVYSGPTECTVSILTSGNKIYWTYTMKPRL
jgi:hypothetical protein